MLRRGACHRAGHFGPDPLAPRNDDRSPDASAPEPCQPPPPKKKCEGSGAPIGAPSVVRACANKRAQRAQTYLLRGSGPLCLLPPPRVGEGREGARSPFGAPPRRLPRRANAKTQSRPRFARTRGCRRYPHHRSRLSQAPGTPVVVPEGHSSLHFRKLRTVMPGPPENGLRIRPQEPHSLHLQDRI